MMTHVCLTPVDGCNNPDTYGMICVRCNECGRFKRDETKSEAGHE